MRATAAQLELLRERGYGLLDGLSREEAARLIRESLALTSLEDARVERGRRAGMPTFRRGLPRLVRMTCPKERLYP